MSDSSRHSIFAIKETVYGTTPDTPAFKTIRHTGTNLGLSKSTLVSEELRPDRQIKDFRHGTNQTGGDIMGEVSYGAYDDFFEGVMCGTWAAKFAPKVATTLSVLASDSSINDSGNGLPVFVAGDKVTVAGFTGTAGNNRAKATVVTSTISKLVLDPAGVPFVDDAAGESVTITSLTFALKAGVVRRSFSVLRHFSDMDNATKPWHLFKGVEYNKLALTITVSAIIKAVFSTLGKQMAAPATAAPAGSTYVDPTTAVVMDSFSGVLYEGGVANAVVTEISMSLENGLQPRFVIGSKNTILPSIGRSNLTGQITAYFEDSTLLDKFINETESQLVFTLADLAGNTYRFTLPRIKYNGGQPDTQGQGAITLAMPIQALYDDATDTNLIVERIPA